MFHFIFIFWRFEIFRTLTLPTTASLRISAVASREANLIRAEKVHRAELERARDAEKIMKSRFEESQATSQSVQKTLAVLVTEKQSLNQELLEVTAISEELASLCEKNNLM